MSDDFEKVEDKPLDNMQINMAQIMIQDLHPISDTPIEVSFPAFCSVFGALRNCFKEDFDKYKKDE